MVQVQVYEGRLDQLVSFLSYGREQGLNLSSYV